MEKQLHYLKDIFPSVTAMHVKPLDGTSQQRIAFDVKRIIKIFDSVSSFVSWKNAYTQFLGMT